MRKIFMYKVGDKVSFGSMSGEIVNIRNKNWIGFHPHSETYYDILFKDIPEESLKQNNDGTD